ncbi:hypothetical protein WR25_19403 [Diploscapter pachys]|uniref:EGF-like domain-containing protein n=1 Tax=Diploscapter pachys TaxID=2018661 RepID=A0A2A2K999_9BILA|nr:hypothetical protein WR25_19403 [Diploscapter pachys]
MAYLYTKNALVGYGAISTSNEIDASVPYMYAQPYAAYNLVARLVDPSNCYEALPASEVQLSRRIKLNSNLTADLQARDGCQYNVNFGTFFCSSAGPLTLILKHSLTSRTAAVPFICADPSKIPNLIIKEEQYSTKRDIYADISNVACNGRDTTHQYLFGKANNKAFRISSRNGPFSSLTNGFDALYVNPTSVFYPLVGYISNKGANPNGSSTFKYFSSNIYAPNDTLNIMGSDNFGYFQTMIMTQRCLENLNYSFCDQTEYEETTSCTCIGDDALPSDLIDALYQLIDYSPGRTNDYTYSDAFFIVDLKNDPSANVTTGWNENQDLIDKIYQRRVRLYIIFIQENNHEFNDFEWNDAHTLAKKSGGAAFRLDTYAQLSDFFKTYFTSLVTADTVFQAIRTSAPFIGLNPLYLTHGNKYTLMAAMEPSDGVPTKPSNVTIMRNGVVVKICSNFTSYGELTIYPIDTSDLPQTDLRDKYTIFVNFLGVGKNIVLTLVELESKSFLNLGLSTEPTEDVYTWGQKPNEFLYPVVGFSDGDADSSESVSAEIYLTIIHNPIRSGFTNIVFNDTLQYRNGCSFSWFANYRWMCKDPGSVYQLIMQAVFPDKNTSMTRTQLLTCPTGDSGNCMNGGSPIDGDNDHCLCIPGFTGQWCDEPNCQNGGSALPTDICQCINGYTGQFCEIAPSNMTCSNSPSLPDFSAELTSLIIVIDQEVYNKSMGGDLIDQTNLNFPGSQIAVVQYGDGFYPKLVLSTTNINLLKDAVNTRANLTAIPTPPPPTVPTTTNVPTTTSYPPVYTLNYASPYPALGLAIDNIVGDRALIVLVASDTTNSPVDPNLINKLSASRVELRIFTLNGDNQCPFTNLLATLGNGIPFTAGNTEKFNSYFNDYIMALFAANPRTTFKSRSILNVYETIGVGCSCNDPLIIRNDPEQTTDNDIITLIIHTRNIDFDKLPSDCNSPLQEVSDSAGSRIVLCNLTSPSETTLRINLTNCNANFSGYSVEKLNYIHTAYGFKYGGDYSNENLNLGLGQGENTMHITSEYSPEATNVREMPGVVLREILYNGSLNDAIVLPSTKKTSGCTYSYYTPSISCGSGTIGYQAQILTQSTADQVTRQQQVVLACANANNAALLNTTFCVHGSSDQNGLCVCDNGWEGVDCSQPICQNYGVRHAHACNCKNFETGFDCSNGYLVPTTMAPPATPAPGTRAFAFIIDVAGNESVVFNTIMDSIIHFCERYQSRSVIVMTIGNDGENASDFAPLNMTDLSNQLKSFATKRRTSFDIPTMLDNTFNTILEKVELARKSGFVIRRDFTGQSNNIFYVTEVVGNLTDNTSLTDLSSPPNDFRLVSVGIYRYYYNISQEVIEELHNLSPTHYYWANNWTTAVEFMSTSSKAAPDYTIAPSSHTPSCVIDVDVNVMLVVELKNTSNYDADILRAQKLKDFVLLFMTDFNLGWSIGCLTNQTDPCIGYSYLAGLGYNADVPKPPSFCSSTQYMSTGLIQQITQTSRWLATSADFRTLKSLQGYLTSTRDDRCVRENAKGTDHFVIWFPTESTTNDSGLYTSLTTSNAEMYYHMIIPQGFRPEDTPDDFYHKIANHSMSKANETNKPFTALLPSFENMTATEAVQIVWTELCKFQNIIPLDATALPPVSAQKWPCNVWVKFKNKSMQKVKAQLFVPSLNTKSDQIVFEADSSGKKVKIHGDNCLEKSWLIRTWKWKERRMGDYWEEAEEMNAKITGNGYIEIHIMPDLKPIVAEKKGVACIGIDCGIT